MIHVLLDTSIYRQDPKRKSAAFQALAKLGNAGELVLHIPYFVKHEFLTHRRDEYAKSLREVESGFKKLTRKPLARNLTEALEKQSAAFRPLITDVLNWVEQDFDSWCGHVGAELHPIKNHHGKKMAEMYFSGELPFGDPKKRDDIPDAFIYLTALDIAEGVDELAVVAADKRLAEACGTRANITTLSSLDLK